MYQISCDGKILYDPRDEELIVNNPRCTLEVNTVGEASFSIYATHKHYSELQKLKSVFEILQDGIPIFRGRMTDDTKDFNNIKTVDLEGVMAFFNDSIIKPFTFPDDFLENADYIESANKVDFFLGWLIEQHNSQVQPFQQFKKGNVTVTDPNNTVSRSNEEHSKTWDVLKTKLFESALGGYLCIRYETDGNYIDYLEDFLLTNPQKIEFGKNLLDLTSQSDASETYSAILPLGKRKSEIDTTSDDQSRLTIEELADGEITDDIVKNGDTLYSKSAVEKYGFIYAPISDSTWDDVTKATNLQTNGMELLVNKGMKMSSTITVKAIDLHLSDDEVEAFRIYKYIEVESKPHDHEGFYKLTRLEIDIHNPQNTVITLGDTQLTMTDINAGTKQNAQTKVETVKVEIQTQFGRDLTKFEKHLLDEVDEIINSQVREAFANDDTDIEISEGLVKYNAGTFEASGAKFVDEVNIDADIYSSSSIAVTSDQNASKNVESLPDTYEAFLDALAPVRFKSTKDDSGKYRIGYMAQDVETALTTAGLATTDFAGYVNMGEDLGLGLSYDNFIALLHLKIKKLEQRLAVLEPQ